MEKVIEVGQIVWFQARIRFWMPRRAEVLTVDHRHDIYTIRLCDELLGDEGELRTIGDNIHLTEVDAFLNLESALESYLAEVRWQRAYAESGEVMEA